MKKRTTLSIILIVLVAITAIFVGKTYARYLSEASASGTVDVASWAIKVNDTDITGAGTTALGTVTLTAGTSANVATGKIAPSINATGSFEVHATGSEVAVDYEFTLGTITASAGTVPTGLSIGAVEYSTDGTNWTAITASSGKYTGTIALANVATPVTVRVTVSWPNDEANNVTDTAAGVSGATLTVPVTITVKQKI